ncbi:transcriptional regulator [Sphingobium sp. Sx8-8]|uniref:transcriptional regulator n=1 Tax=Sphingobium sp. Sx8-8 TaxID=2933617 RepID=UPI001F5A979B|nr:transcriptional regulator [Sphingobium sp. Sx8-8]
MLVFLDFEASSLGKKSHPIEVGWAFEDGRKASYLIRPAPHWLDWDPAAAAIHRITRQELKDNGIPHDRVARIMMHTLGGHDLLASAPSWDGKWLSTILRAAGFPRHSLRLRRSGDAHREVATAILSPIVPAERLEQEVMDLLAHVDVRAGSAAPAHRALADAEAERRHYIAVADAARIRAADLISSM